MKKICAIIGVAVALSTSGLHAGFDDSVKGGQSDNYSIPSNLGNFQQLFDSISQYFHVTLPVNCWPVNYPPVTTPKTPASVVPEPTTIIAGALLLLPFGVSTIRILRRNKAVKPVKAA